MSVLRLLGRAIVWAFIGAIATPFLGGLVMLVVTSFDSKCGTPGDSGGCEMGLAVIFLALVPIGAIIFFLAVILRALFRTLELKLPE